MACCFKDDPVSQEELNKSPNNKELTKFVSNVNTFDIKMAEAPKEECLYCLYGALPFTCLCAQMQSRYEVLNHLYPDSKWEHYVCCQGITGDCLCIRPGKMGEENCPAVCLCCEVCCCPGIAVSATRFLMMQKYQLRLDPCDNQIVRFNNALQGCLIFLRIFNRFGGTDRSRDFERFLKCLADAVYFTTQGCMLAQVHRELKKRAPTEAPAYQRMEDREIT